MAHANHSIELNIVAASDVRRYAADILLPQPKREAVEHVLLDDDRARDLVVQVSKRFPKNMTRQLEAKSRQACKAGMDAVNAYYALIRTNGACSRTRTLAACRIHLRKSLLQSLQSLLPHSEAAAINSESVSSSVLAGKSERFLPEEVAKLDFLFIRALRACFHAPSHPYYKAKFANFIAVMNNEYEQIHWSIARLPEHTF